MVVFTPVGVRGEVVGPGDPARDLRRIIYYINLVTPSLDQLHLAGNMHRDKKLFYVERELRGTRQMIVVR